MGDEIVSHYLVDMRPTSGVGEKVVNHGGTKKDDMIRDRVLHSDTSAPEAKGPLVQELVE